MHSSERPTVLVVDDNRLNIDLLVDVLKDDYKLLVALNGVTALEVIEETLPDIILLDIMMPEMDGYEVCRRLKSDERSAQIPVIFITGPSPRPRTRPRDWPWGPWTTSPSPPTRP